MHKVTSWVSAALTVAAGVTFAHSAHAQAWKPERPVEITVPSGPGGSNDVAGRVIQKLFDDLKLLGQPSSVVNRDGGGHTIAYSYVQQRAGDPHRIGIMSTPILMNFVEGRTQMSYKDVTPIAYMITEPMVAAVRADSPIKTGQDLLNALKKDPNSLSIALTSVGHRVSIGIPMQKAGVDTKGVRVVVFKSGGETTTAVLGGHADGRQAARHRSECGSAAGRTACQHSDVERTGLRQLGIVERHRRAAQYYAGSDCILGTGFAESGAEQGDRRVRRKEPVAGGVQECRRNAQVDGGRDCPAAGRAHGAGTYQARLVTAVRQAGMSHVPASPNPRIRASHLVRPEGFFDATMPIRLSRIGEMPQNLRMLRSRPLRPCAPKYQR
jgi:hypothetical protein